MNRSLLESVVRRISATADGAISDADLLKRFAASRDESAFAAIVRRHGPLVWAVCRGLLPLEQDAEDAFQATFLALVKAAQSVRAPSSVGAWLHGAAYRVALKARRTAGRRRPRERAVARSEAAAPIADCTWNQLRAAVHEEVSRLPETLRAAFVMCELEGVGQREAAAALGWKIGTLSGRLTKARKRLLERLDRRGVSAGLAVATAVTGGSATAGIPPSWIAKVMILARTSGDLSGIVSNSILELARGATEVTMTRTKLMAAAAILAVVVGGTATALVPLAGAQAPAPPGATPAALPAGGQPPAPPALPSGPDTTPVPETAQAAPPALPAGPGLQAAPGGAPVPSLPTAPTGAPPAPIGVPGMPGMAPATPYSGMGMAPPTGLQAHAQWEYNFVPSSADAPKQEFRRLLVRYGNEGWEYCGMEPAAAGESNLTLVFKRMKGHGAGQAMGGGLTTPAAPPAYPAPGQTRPTGGSVAPKPTTPSADYNYYGKTAIQPAGPGMGVGAPPKPGTTPVNPATAKVANKEATVVHLSHGLADEIATVLSDVFAERGRIVSDPRSNSVILIGDDAVVAQMQRLIHILDKTPDGSSNVRGK